MVYARTSRAGLEVRTIAPSSPARKPIEKRRECSTRRFEGYYADNRRRRANARSPPHAAIRPGSPAPTAGPGTVTKVSGPVPNENVAVVIVVLAVTPERLRVKVSGPTTYGLNCPWVIEALAFPKLVPEGRSS